VPAQLQGDPGRLRQVLTNLMGNAVKFTETGGVSLEVALEEDSAEDVVVRFTVHDTGIGIPAHKMETLFQPFTQADSSMTRRYGGTGLGLSISRRLVELMRGRIGVESREGAGSTFWFTARLARQPGTSVRSEISAPNLAGLRVLTVDDSDASRRAFAGLLSGLRCHHEEVADSPTALARLQQAAREGKPYRVAILNQAAPGENGEPLFAAITRDAEIRGVQLVLVTPAGRREDPARLVRAGFAAQLTKPVRQAHLRACLQNCVGGTAPEPAATAAPHALDAGVGRPTRILLAEDNRTNQRLAIAFLEKMGHRVDAVANGAEAVEALRSRPYDLVLMDVQMPEMDGLEATRLVRQTSTGVRNPDIPVVAMTAHAMKGDRERCLEAGMNDYLSKPINRAELAAVIERWLSERRSVPHPGEPESARTCRLSA
jgi:CheY-like chemotaxis protein